MHISVLKFLFYLLLSSFFVACDSNINSFNIDIKGTVDYIKNNNSDINSTNTNTGSNTNTNTNTGSNTNTNTNTGSNTNTNTGSNTGNTNNTVSTSEIVANLGAQIGTRSILEVAPGSGIPVTAGESIEIEEYAKHYILKYSKNLTKVKYSNDIANIGTEGVVSTTIAKIPNPSNFIKVYFNSNGDSVSKIFEIPKTSKILP